MCIKKIHDKYEAVTIEIYTPYICQALLAPSMFWCSKMPWVWDSSKHTVFQIHLCPIETLGDLMSWMLNACVMLITWDEMHKITIIICITVIESAKSHPDTGVSARSPWRNTKSLESGPRFLLHVLSSVAISCHVWQCISGTIFGKMLLNRNGHNRTQHDPTGHNTWGPAQDHLPKSNNSGPPDVRDGIAIQDQLLVIRMCPSTYNI